MKELPSNLIAEASAWLAVLHGPNRTAAVEQSLSRWLRAHTDHARAFELATEGWNEPLPVNIRRLQPKVRSGLNLVPFAIAAVVAAAGIGLYFYLHPSGVATDVGEQRLIVLADQSRVLLNTATHIVVRYNAQERRVELESGEALFEVAQHAERPFVVTVGDKSVTALGTSFTVRRDPHQIAVTLLDGKVQVSALTPSADRLAESGQVLAPGQRMTFTERAAAKLDRPAMDHVLAWQRREVALDNTALPEAVSEMNRYSGVPLVVEQPRLQRLRISGRFRAGDSLSFAHAVATTYQLAVVQERDRVVLIDPTAGTR